MNAESQDGHLIVKMTTVPLRYFLSVNQIDTNKWKQVHCKQCVNRWQDSNHPKPRLVGIIAVTSDIMLVQVQLSSTADQEIFTLKIICVLKFIFF